LYGGFPWLYESSPEKAKDPAAVILHDHSSTPGKLRRSRAIHCDAVARYESHLLNVRSSFKPPLGPVPILAEPSAVKKIKWFRKIFGNFIPNFRERVAKTKNYKLKTKPEQI